MSSTTEALSPENGEVADEATVRDQFKTVVADRGVALAKIAPETGVHYSTLAAWNSASYSGNNARVTEQIRQWLVTQEARSRMQTALPRAPSFVRTDTALAIIDVLEAAQTLPDIALVTGGAGIGKTMTIGWYQEKAANVIALSARCWIRSRGLWESLAANRPARRPNRSAAVFLGPAACS